MSFNPKKRYSAVVVFSEDLERVVLIHKQKPDWQAGKANVPGGKVGENDDQYEPCQADYWDLVHRHCATRELHEETGLDIAATALKLFCRLRFKTPEGDAAECCFYAVRGDVDAVRTMEEERVFVEEVDCVLGGYAENNTQAKAAGSWWLPTMPNLPYLVAMARQCLRGEGLGSWPLTIHEAGATP